MRELILARHGESTASHAEVVDGDPTSAVDLTAEGEAQARALGEVLREREIHLCVTSRFLRTRRTAELALAGRQTPRLVLDDLDDMRFGELQGVPVSRYREWISEHGIDAAPRGGESRVATVTRFTQALRALLRRPEQCVLAVTHGLTVAYACRAAAGGELDTPPLPPPYATPHTLRADQVEHAVARLQRWLDDRMVTRCT